MAGFEALFPSADSSHRSRAFAASFRMSTLGGTTMPVQQTEGVRGLDVFGVFIGQILSAPSLTGALICLWCWFHGHLIISHLCLWTVWVVFEFGFGAILQHSLSRDLPTMVPVFRLSFQ